MIHNGSFMYPQMPYNAASAAAAAAAAANYSQYYGDNGFHSICAAEGMPLYQLAGMNGGHSFMSMSNCPTSYMTPSTASYLNQTAAAAYSNPYQTAAGPVTGYTIYPAAMGQAPSQAPQPQAQPPPSMGMHTAPPPTQHHSMAAAYQHHSQQAAAAAAVAAANQAHMLANVTSMPNAYGHQYSAACGAAGGNAGGGGGPQAAAANSNSAVALHAMRSYGAPLPPGHHMHSGGQAAQVYIFFVC